MKTNRLWIPIIVLFIAAVMLGACGPKTVVVEETVEVEKMVKETVEIEKIVEVTVEVERELFSSSGFGATMTPLSTVQKWVQAHNKYRCMHGVPPLRWSSKLAASALACASKCQWAHCGSGENKAAGSGPLEDIVDMWYGEEKKYNYNNPGFSTETGHFTQVVWKSAKEIGCAYCPNCKVKVEGQVYPGLWVCQYDTGNVGGQYTQNVPPPVKGEAACKTTKATYCSTCKAGQGAWVSDTNDCWKIDGYAPGTIGNPGTDCNVCWQSHNIIGCGTNPPPLPGFWHKIGGQGGAWQAGGYPPGWTPAGCWRLLSTSADLIRCSGPLPDLKGLRVGGQLACWTQLTSSGASSGITYCEY